MAKKAKKCKTCGQYLPDGFEKPEKKTGKERYSVRTDGKKCHIWREPK